MLPQVLSEIEGSPVASYLRGSRWGYASISALHILGIAALIGSVIPLNLKLLGAWPATQLAALARVLVPVAACGLTLAVFAGALLFSVRAHEYAALGVFQIKLLCVVLGTLSALRFHWRFGLAFDGAADIERRIQAILSLGCWLGALVCGRLIAFAGF